jgi:hypothetical protein
MTTTPELAAALGCAEVQLQRWVTQGVLPHPAGNDKIWNWTAAQCQVAALVVNAHSAGIRGAFVLARVAECAVTGQAYISENVTVLVNPSARELNRGLRGTTVVLNKGMKL